MRAVFDTNVLISGVLWRGPPYDCLLAAEGRLFELFVSEAILDEFAEKLILKFGLTKELAAQTVQYVRQLSEPVALVGQSGWVKSDPDDDKIVETAIAADASYIVSGDRHLLDLEALEGITILSARDFLALLRLKDAASQD
jgi:putative PIN family toxin of toxin-antitoxin system